MRRLLAAEIYDRMNNEYSVPCSLVTGQQVFEIEDATHTSCTIGTVRLHLETLLKH